MEAILIGALAQYLIPLLGVAITALAGYGISLLKKKTDSDIGKNALDQIGQIIDTVVGDLAQTTVKHMIKMSKDGRLGDGQKVDLRLGAFTQTKSLISKQLEQAAERSVSNLPRYIRSKIEERVGAGKRQKQ